MTFHRFVLAGCSLLLAAGAVFAQSDYPSKPIRIIVPLAAGSAVDNAARIVAARMSQTMGQGILIENQPGASGLIGADRVAKAAPDGYTLGGFNDSIMTMVPHMQSKMPWDIMRDFEPVSLVATLEWGMVVDSDSAIRTPADLIEAARKAPGTINYGSGGNGSPQHVAMAMFASQANIDLKHVPYKGATQAATGVAGKEVQTALQGIATVNSLVQAGKLRLIAVPAAKRMPQFPEVPTVAESGLPGFEFESWFTLMAPAKTPKAIVDRLQREVTAALADPDTRSKLIAGGMVPRGTTPAELRSATATQFEKYGALMKKVNITAE
ncbi:conserved exported hypothetical protein [Burkholderiales bacterium 8X]|nr:conserved exported hypothetical protein [Burkholderiales bacterium 8X]